MLGCEVLFGKAQGARVRALVEGSSGSICPCALDEPCPLIKPPTAAQVSAVTAGIVRVLTGAQVPA